VTDTVSNLASSPSTGASTLISYFANNAVAANLLMLLFLVGGFLTVQGLKSELFPSVDQGIIVVSVVYPGAAPSEVQDSITERVDVAVKSIEGVDRIVSRASEGYSRTTIELKDFVDSDKVLDDVQAAIDSIQNFPPQDAEEPQIVNPVPLGPVMTLIVKSLGDEQHLDEGVRRLETDLLALPEVSHVTIQGVREHEITIEISENDLRKYNLTFDELSNTLRRSSLNLSSGEIRTESGDLLIRTDQKKETVGELSEIVIRTLPGGAVLRLDEIATIIDGFVDDDISLESNGERAAFLTIEKSDSENVLKISDAVLDFFDSYQLPPGISVNVWENQSDILRSRLSLLVRNGVLGFALVFTFLVLMLDLRLAFWVAMGVPISFLGGFLLFGAVGVDINMISLFALIIVLGLVVDDAIIVGESIDAERATGLTGSTASIAGVRRVAAPVLVGVTTTMIAFVPLMLIGGRFGPLFGVIPTVVICVLIISLIEVFFIMPAHLAHSRRWSRFPLDRIQDRVAAVVQAFRDQIVTPLVKLVVRYRYLTLIYGLAFLITTVTLVANGVIKVDFFPSIESDFVTVNVTFPVGTPYTVTDRSIRTIQEKVYEVNDSLGGTSVQGVTLTSGGSIGGGGGPGPEDSLVLARNVAGLEIQLSAESQRSVSALQFQRLLQDAVGDVPGADSVSFSSEFFDEANLLSYEMIHENDDLLRQAVQTLREELRAQTFIQEISDTSSAGKRQLDIHLTPAGQAAGLVPAVVARQLRQSFFGEEIQRITRAGDEVKVMLRYPKAERSSTANVFDARIRLPDGTQVPFSTVARVEESRSYSAIDRVDGFRVITVSAGVDKRLMTTGEASQAVQTEIIDGLLKQFPGLQIAETGFSSEQAQDLSSMITTGSLAIAVIFTIIAIQMRSYSLPVAVVLAIPFGAAGAVLGHYILGFDLSIVSMFGIIALCGVVLNDSVVLIDRYRRFRNEGQKLGRHEAIVEAARSRFRAIFLTTATTTLGLTPMLFETSLQARFLIPMAVSLATGIVFASLITLFLLPAIISIGGDMRNLVNRFRSSQTENSHVA